MTEVECAIMDVGQELAKLHGRMVDAHPTLRGNLGISGCMLGAGLADFVTAGLTDDEIAHQVRLILDGIRSGLRNKGGG
jgi:hypothetical protein